MSQEDDALDPVLFNTFIIKSKRWRVYFRKSVLIWESEGLPLERCTVPVCDIIAVDFDHGKECSCQGSYDSSSNLHTFQETPGSPFLDHHSFEVHYAKEKEPNKWRVQSVSLYHGDARQTSSWLKTLQNALSFQRLTRPRHVLVFVNPFCGKRKGVEIYTKTVEPIFRLARVQTEVIITEHGGHAREVIFSRSLEEYDGIVTVGGDGTVSEIMNSLVLRKARDLGIDENDCNVEIPKVDIPVAMIPGGSTDCIVYCLNGTLDRKTAAIYTVLGSQFGLDICGVYSGRGLRRYFLSMLGYGFLGDVLKESEKHRWMGPKRYDYSGFLTVLRNRRYYCEVDMLLSGREAGSGPKCFKNCAMCNAKAADADSKPRYEEKKLTSIRNLLRLEDPTVPEKRLTVRGKYFLLSCANISCACVRSPNGLAPHCHVGDGAMDVLLLQPRSLLDVLKLLVYSASKKDNVAVSDLPFIDIYKVKELSVKMLDKNMKTVEKMREDGGRCVGASVWNCDGEIVSDSNLKIKNYQQLVSVFTRRQVPAPAKTVSSCCGCLFQKSEMDT